MRYYGDCSPSNWLFRPLDNVPNRVVLDANVLLDFLLIVDGLGCFVLDGLYQRGFTLFTTTVAIEEVKRALSRERGSLSDLSPLVEKLLTSGEIKVISPATVVPEISKHDNHLAAVALEQGACIVSEDLPFLRDLNHAKIHARSLREVALWLILPHQPSQDLTVFGQGAGADGHVFLKAMPDFDVANNSLRSFYLFDAEYFGSLRYDGIRKSFVFSSIVGGELLLKLKLVPENQYAILVNYSVGRRTSITMKVRCFGGNEEFIANGEFPPFTGRPTGEIIVVNSRAKDAGWSGSLQALTFGPYQLNAEVWRASHSLVGVAPPTLTADLTFTAAILTEVKGDRVRRPLRKHVLELVNMSIPGFYPGRRASERPAEWFEKGGSEV